MPDPRAIARVAAPDVVYSGMFFRRSKKSSGRADLWRELVERLELHDATDRAERLGRHLALDGARLESVHALRRSAQPTLYLFDLVRSRRGPSGSVEHRGSAALLRAHAPFVRDSFRAIPKAPEPVERLEAGRSGGATISLEGSPELEGKVTVFARDPDQAVEMLTRPVRTVLARTLTETGVERIMVGERHILALTETEPLELEDFEGLAADVLSLYAALLAQGRGADPTDPDARAKEF